MYLGIDGNMILKWIRDKKDWSWARLTLLNIGQVTVAHAQNIINLPLSQHAGNLLPS